jgi:hypothetical protein
MEIEAYNLIEEKNKIKLSNLIIESFYPIHFEKSGYPTRIKEFNELGKYIDVMQENRFFDNLKKLNGVTKNEFEIIKKIAKDILIFSKKFNLENRGRNCLSRVLISKRIHDIFLKKNDSVFEIGPGSGYYASISYETDIKYFGLEITQAFYLYQSNFYNSSYHKDYSNYALSEEEKKINQIPWWLWVKKDADIKFNLATANHVLCEMHPNSLLFTFKKIINLYINPEKKILICEGLGSRRFSSAEHVVFLMRKIGWNLCNNADDIFIFIHNSSSNTFKREMSYIRKINFKYLFYIFRFEKKNIFKSLFSLLKLFKKNSYIHNLEIRKLSNFNLIYDRGIDEIDNRKILDFFNNETNQNFTEDEVFLNYIKLPYI